MNVRDQADIFLSLREYNEEYSSDTTDCNIAFLIYGTMLKVEHFNVMLILKDICSQLKRDSMLFLIDLVFSFVPLKLHK